MLKTFKTYLEAIPDYKTTASTLLAVSGGIDSVVMCHLYKQSGLPFGLAHCNFNLREAASDGDAEFVKQLAAELAVPYFQVSFQTEQYAHEHKISIQMAARALRYEWLESIRTQNNFAYLATAHHLNDAVETVIYNLAKSCGIRGLHGIKNISGTLIRPLLFATKQDIVSYANEYDIKFREDASNASTKYSRNFIRHKIIPLLEEINPSFIEGVSNTIGRLRQTEFIYLESIERFKELYCEENVEEFIIHTTKLTQHPSRESILYELLRPQDFNYSQVQQIFESGYSEAGRTFYSADYELLVDREKIIVRQKTPKQAFEISIKREQQLVEFQYGKLLLELVARPAAFDPSPNIAYLDIEKLQFPLQVRHWEAGDSFQPFGMFGKSQKLKEFFINNKLSIFEKDKVKLLVSNNEIAWVIGYRIDHRFCLGDYSKHCLRMEWV